MHTFESSENRTFSEALDALKAGNRVARAGWNGKGMWLVIVDCAVDNGDFNSGTAYETRGNQEELIAKLEQLPWLGMKTADGGFVPWLASQTDLLAEDWEILDEMVPVSTFQTDQDGNHIEVLVPKSELEADLAAKADDMNRNTLPTEFAELNAELVDVSQAYSEAMVVANECGYAMMSLEQVIRDLSTKLAAYREVEVEVEVGLNVGGTD